MILNQSPDNIAIVSGVQSVGEFAIKNSAKAFMILSDGLYANKIRAVIRELGCNAYDSHVAAGKGGLPFDVHLPNNFEPYFSIRDYGVGLSHDEVVNIYTTYFESTKTNSNEFIGALGLGSKSPFSYTENFTVTAVKNGVKGIYTAFINDRGVPSIALMTSEETNEPAGVEVKFAVEIASDFNQFKREAEQVFKYFATTPVITGNQAKIETAEYSEKDIVPGIHVVGDSGYGYRYRGYQNSYAVMGNIQYPIDVPNSEQSLGSLSELLNMNLEIHFANGSLDFQASREGLRYSQMTVDAIKARLEELQNSLYTKFVSDIERHSNIWERTLYAVEKVNNSRIWRASLKDYAKQFPDRILVDTAGYVRDLEIFTEDTREKFNISVQAFRLRGKIASDISYFTNVKNESYLTLYGNRKTMFVKSDKPKGYLARTKYHFTTLAKDNSATPDEVFLLNVADASKPADFDGFFKSIYSPPESNIMQVSSLMKPEPKPRNSKKASNVTILSLVNSGRGYDRQTVWREDSKLGQLDNNKIYPYIPLKGFVSDDPLVLDPKALENAVYYSGIGCLKNFKLYGVRRGDLELVREMKNWVPVIPYLQSVIDGLDRKDFYSRHYTAYNREYTPLPSIDPTLIQDSNSLYRGWCSLAKPADRAKSYLFDSLMIMLDRKIDTQTIDKEAKEYYSQIVKKYPLIKNLQRYTSAIEPDIAEYINLIDSHKGE